MKILLLTDELYEYLQHVIRSHTGSGIAPEEGLAAYQLWQQVGKAQDVDTTKLGKVQLEKVGPDGITLTTAPEPETSGPVVNDGVKPMKRGDLGA